MKMFISKLVRVDGKLGLAIPEDWEKLGWKEGADVWVTGEWSGEEYAIKLVLVDLERVSP